MAKSGIPRDPKIYLALFLLFGLLLGMMPRSGKFNYDYRKGSPWAYETLISQIDFPILKTAEQIQSERDAVGTGVVPYYRYDEGVLKSVTASVGLSVPDNYSFLKTALLKTVSDVYARGIISDEMALSDEKSLSDVIFVQKDKRVEKYPTSDVYTIKSATKHIASVLENSFPEYNADSLISAFALVHELHPNLIYDIETTNLVHAQSVDFISPTKGFVSAGQRIVSKGEIITGEIAQLLDSYKYEYEMNLGYNGPRWLLWIGNGIIALAIVLILFLSIYYTNGKIFNEMNRFLYLLFVFSLTSLSTFLVDRFNPSILYMVPFSLTALFLLAFFRKRVVLPVYVLSLLPLLIFAHNGIELFVLYLVAGVITMYVFQYYSRGWRQFVTAMIVFVALLLTFVGFRLINDGSSLNDYTLIMYLLLGSFLSVAGYPLIYLFEKIFGLVSNSRLMELADPNSKPLRILAQKAPGTFQHSLQVMNMADAVARSVDANVLLVRAGAMYHDIGKTENPKCFIENENIGSSYHDQLSPLESAEMIIRHVTDGLVLASKYNIPSVVSDFILSHHGTSTASFFYSKHLKEGGSPDMETRFRYKGRLPETKEQTIVMICDTVEAASRTLADNSPQTFDKFVEGIVASKINAGQLDKSEISLKELSLMKQVLKTYLSQIYHDRVVYPDQPSV